MATSLASLTASQLRRAADIKAQIERLSAELDALVSDKPAAERDQSPGRPNRRPRKRRKISAAGRARIAAAQRERWAKVRAAKRDK